MNLIIKMELGVIFFLKHNFKLISILPQKIYIYYIKRFIYILLLLNKYVGREHGPLGPQVVSTWVAQSKSNTNLLSHFLCFTLCSTN
jgi:hypothetical protein